MILRSLTYVLSPLAALCLWELLAWAAVLDVRFFPPPTEILHYLIFVSPGEGLIRDLSASLYRIAWGYSAGSLAGGALGIAMGLSVVTRNCFYPLVAMTYPVPKIAILPLIMLIFGIGELSKIVVVAIGSFFLVLMNTMHGVRSLPGIYHDVAAVNQVSRVDLVFRVVLPGALPSIFTGLKLAIGYSLVIVVAAEFSGADAGIGYLIWQSWETFSITAMYAGIFVIGALGFVFSYGLELLERWLVPWRRDK